MNLAEIAWTAVLAGGGGAAVAFGVIRFFGEKWLDNKFASRLQDLRHEHEKQMESVKLTSSETLDRSVRLAEREFDTTFEVWGLVANAYVKTMSALPGLRTTSDFSRLSDKLARIASEQTGLEEWEIEALLDRPQADRNAYYNERRAVHEISAAKRAIWDADSFLSRNSLFIDASISDELKGFVDWSWQAMVSWEIVGEVRRQGGGPADLDGIKRDDDDYRKEAGEKLQELEKLVRARFWGGSSDASKED